MILREVDVEPERTGASEVLVLPIALSSDKARFDAIEQHRTRDEAHGILVIRDSGFVNEFTPSGASRRIVCVRQLNRQSELPDECGRYVGSFFDRSGSRWRVFEHRHDTALPLRPAQPPSSTAPSASAPLASSTASRATSASNSPLSRSPALSAATSDRRIASTELDPASRPRQAAPAASTPSAPVSRVP